MKNGDNQAFPTINPKFDGNWNKEPIVLGLTKREYFTGLAMQGFLAATTNLYSGSDIVNQSVIMADKLLKELDK